MSSPNPPAPTPSTPDYEILTLSYWLAHVPDLEDVTIIVRRYGRPARTILLEPEAAIPPSASYSLPAPASDE
jgi:hypothetical protein